MPPTKPAIPAASLTIPQLLQGSAWFPLLDVGADALLVLGRQLGVGAVAVHFRQRGFESANPLLLALGLGHLDVAADGLALGVAGGGARGLRGGAEGGERGRGGQHEGQKFHGEVPCVRNGAGATLAAGAA